MLHLQIPHLSKVLFLQVSTSNEPNAKRTNIKGTALKYLNFCHSPLLEALIQTNGQRVIGGAALEVSTNSLGISQLTDSSRADIKDVSTAIIHMTAYLTEKANEGYIKTLLKANHLHKRYNSTVLLKTL